MKTGDIAALVDGEISGSPDIEIHGIALPVNASPGDLIFFEKNENIIKTNADCILVPLDLVTDTENSLLACTIKVRHPKLAFALAASKIIEHETRHGRHQTANISSRADVNAGFIGAYVSIGKDSVIGKNAELHNGVSIGRNVHIGEGTVVLPNSVIYDNSVIGDNCVIHAGAIIGAPGFGYVRDDSGKYHQFPQVGRVVIEDNVEIGANTCIDRGALGETHIGYGTKIDNLVQIGHNVTIGQNVVIASQTGISGSVTIEDNCVIGGQVGFGDHILVKSGAVIGSQAGILPGKIVRPGVWWGTPIQPLDEFKRQNARIKALEKLIDDVKALKKQVGDK